TQGGSPMPIMFSNTRRCPSVDFGSGGMPFSYQPPSSGFALVGLAIRSGWWIDQVTPIFAEMWEDGSTGPELFGPSFGGWGGTWQEGRGPTGPVVTGLQTGSGNYMDAIRLWHTRWDGSLVQAESGWTAWYGAWGGGGVERTERLAEPQGGAVAVGIAGRAATY